MINPSNAAVFPEYILPNTRALATDPEVLPRATYAQCIALLANQAKVFLEMTEAMKTEGTFKLANVHDFATSPYDVSFHRANVFQDGYLLGDADIGELRYPIARTSAANPGSRSASLVRLGSRRQACAAVPRR